MKRIAALSLALVFLLAGCARKAENVGLKEGTPAYHAGQGPFGQGPVARPGGQ